MTRVAGSTARQLVLDLSRAPGFDRDDFLVSPANEAAVAAVRAWPDWPSRTLLLIGPPGSGKSHLAAIWAADTGATFAPTALAPPPSLWEGGGRCVVLEDCDRPTISEAAFFHTLNLVHETGGWLIMTARLAPRSWGVTMPDLASRLRLATLAEIERPDGELVKAILVKLFLDRQILIDDDVISYAARHCEQSLEAVNRFVAAIDEAALSGGRRITRALAASTLALLQPLEED